MNEPYVVYEAPSPLLMTGSGLERLSLCVAAGVLPQRRTLWVNKSAALGLVVHKFLAEVPAMGVEAALALVPEQFKKFCRAINLAKLELSPDNWVPEVGFKYNVLTDTAEEIGRGENQRDLYEPEEGVVYGTADRIAVRGDTVLVQDYKTGQADLAPAKTLWQVKFYSLAAARAYGCTRAEGDIVRIGHDGEVHFEHFIFEADELAAIAGDLLQLVAQVEEAREHIVPQMAQTTEGPHCKFCHSRPYCPAMSGMARDIGAHQVDSIKPKVALTPELAKRVLERVALYRDACDDAERQVRDYAAEVDIPLGNGWVLGMKECPATEFDPEKALPILTEIYGEQAALAAVEVKATMTQDRLREALREHFVKQTPGAGITKVFANAMKQLKERGGATTTTMAKVTRYKPKTEAPKTEELPCGDDGPAAEAAPEAAALDSGQPEAVVPDPVQVG